MCFAGAQRTAAYEVRGTTTHAAAAATHCFLKTLTAWPASLMLAGALLVAILSRWNR